MKDRKHYAFCSQTGSEIALIAEKLGRWPDKIITNKRPKHLRTISPKLAGKEIIYLSNKPTIQEYLEVLGNEPCNITLHGWLRIVPPAVLERYSFIYNGHPGLITKFPALKGKDPQKKAFDMGIPISGCVIHKVTVGVDEGPILAERQVEIAFLNLDEVYGKLHEASVGLWIDFIEFLYTQQK